MRRPTGRALSLALALALLPLATAPARAQGPCAPGPTAHRSWPAPLDRAVTLSARDLSLRDALDRLSAAARVELSYSPDLLPLGRRVCVGARAAALGDVLGGLLASTGVEPTVVAGQVVLSPSRASRTESTEGDVEPAPRVTALDALVVTGTPAGGPRRPVAVGLEVIDGAALARRSESSLAAVLNGSVPGMWAWRQAPSSLVAQYGSVRGASSFGATYPKVYVDGIEAANPLLVTEIDPDAVERVEVIRGPQGAALYGSDAISGVIQIVTRHDGAGEGASRAQVRSRAGFARSDYAAGALPTHEQRISLRGGSHLRSGGLSLTFSQTGAVFPGSESRRVGAAADGRWVGSGAIVTATGRFVDARAGVGRNPLLPADSVGVGDDERQRVQQYTLGATARLGGGGRWTHTLLAGVDGYRLDYVEDPGGPLPFAVDSALRAARGGGDRATLRASTTAALGDPAADLSGSLTLAAERSVLRQRSLVDEPARPLPGERVPLTRTALAEQWRHNTGVLAQGSGAWRDALFATAGVRVERNDAFSDGGLVTLPMAGLSWVTALGAAEVKLRAAYGRGVRAPRTPAREHQRMRERDFAAGLDPEVQQGVEAGAELHLGETLVLQATRFDQRATGLIQDVVTGVDSVAGRGGPVRRARVEPQNVGAIDNTGWEAQAALSRGPLSLSAAAALVRSRVRRVAGEYRGDLRAGDRVLGVPARTASLTAEWSGGRWSASVTASRAWDWVGYDRLALARDFVSDTLPPGGIRGPVLRRYWRAYDGQTELRAGVTREVARRVSLVVSGENLLGGQLGEPDNATVRAGRTLTVGVRAGF